MGRLLPAALAACAVAAAFAGVGFVTLPAGSSAPPEQRLRTAAREIEAIVLTATSAPEDVAAAEQGASVSGKWLGAGLLAGMVLAMASAPAEAEVFKWAVSPTPEKFTIKAAKHLELCKNNKKYAKKMKDRIFKVTNRQKKYPKDSVVYNRLEQKVASLKRRQENYGDRLCGKQTGLPVTVASGELVRGGIMPASFAFLYIAGWIGWAGRSYNQRTRSKEKEIMIDVPLALTCMASGFSWPVAAWQEIVNGELIAKDSDIYRSGAAYFN